MIEQVKLIVWWDFVELWVEMAIRAVEAFSWEILLSCQLAND